MSEDLNKIHNDASQITTQKKLFNLKITFKIKIGIDIDRFLSNNKTTMDQL